MQGARSPMLKVAAFGALVGPAILFFSDLLLGPPTTVVSFEWTIGNWAAMMLMIPAAIGLTFLLASIGSRLAIMGGCFAFFGLVAGASMQVLFRVYAVLEEQGAMATADQLRATFKLFASTQMIGLTWPIGLILLSIACLTTRAVNIAVPILLIIGAIAFPIGRIAGSRAGVLISGAAFVFAFGTIGVRLWSISEEKD